MFAKIPVPPSPLPRPSALLRPRVSPRPAARAHPSARVRLAALLGALLVSAAACRAGESPFRSDFLVDGTVLTAEAGILAGGFLLAQAQASRTFDPQSHSRGEIPAFDRWAIGPYAPPLALASDALALAAGLLPPALSGYALFRGRENLRDAWTDMAMYAEGFSLAVAASYYAKLLEVHPRPLAFTDEAPASVRAGGDARSGFFSTHAAGAFAAAVFAGYAFQARNPGSAWIPWVWAGALGLAGSIGALRVASGDHFPSDILAGAAVGSACGYLAPRLHRTSRNGTAGIANRLPSLAVSAVPEPGGIRSRAVLTAYF